MRFKALVTCKIFKNNSTKDEGLVKLNMKFITLSLLLTLNCDFPFLAASDTMITAL